MKTQSMCSFGWGFFYSACFWNSSVLWHILIVCFLPLLSSIPLYPAPYWWITGLFPDFSDYEQELLWTYVFISLRYVPKSERVELKGGTCLVLQAIARPLPKWSHHFIFPKNIKKCMSSDCSISFANPWWCQKSQKDYMTQE
jgi:hypothetical protein